MAKNYLIDTSAVIKYLNGSLNQVGLTFIDGIIDSDCSLSFITEIELQVWKPTNESDIEVFREFVRKSESIGIDDTIVEETIRIRKAHSLKLPDAIIAATAISKGLTLLADNDKDFAKVSSLRYINPNKINL